jgi:hypothetical protein
MAENVPDRQSIIADLEGSIMDEVRRGSVLAGSPKRFALVVVMSLLLAGAAGAEAATVDASPTRWASAFCGSFLTWEQAAKTGAAKLTKVLNALAKSGHANLKNERAQLVGFLGGFRAATGRLQASMKAVGPPAVKNGGKIQTIIRSGIAKAQAAVAAGEKQAAALPTNNTAVFVRETNSLAKSFTTTFDKLANSFSVLKKYSPPSLTAAAKADPACKKLG